MEKLLKLFLLFLLVFLPLLIFLLKSNSIDYYEYNIPNIPYNQNCPWPLCTEGCPSGKVTSMIFEKNNVTSTPICNFRAPNLTCDNNITGADDYNNQPISSVAYYSVGDPTLNNSQYYCLVPNNGFDTSQGGNTKSCGDGYTCVPRNKQGEVDPMVYRGVNNTFCGGTPFSGFWQGTAEDARNGRIPPEYQFCDIVGDYVYCAMKLNGTFGTCTQN